MENEAVSEMGAADGHSVAGTHAHGHGHIAKRQFLSGSGRIAAVHHIASVGTVETVFGRLKLDERPLVFISVELDIAHGTDVPMAGKILFCVVHYRSSFFCCLDRRVFSLFCP